MHAPASSARAKTEGADDTTGGDAVLRPLAEVAGREGLAPLASRLFELRAWLASDLSALEAGIATLDHGLQLHSDTSDGADAAVDTGTGKAVQHLLQLPGKRIRPLCVMLAARLGTQQNTAHVHKAAIACELVHAATLLHDDVVDDSSERRGAPAARVLFGNSASILAGDHLLTHALGLVHQIGQPALLGELLSVMTRMVQAEAQQLERRGSFVPSRTAYLQVIRGKTAALFGWGLRAGASLGQLAPAQQNDMEQVGLRLGMAFQLVDDVLDMEGDPRVTGKEALQDMREGKLTWPLILASEQDPSLASELAELARVGPQQAGKEAVQQVMRKVRASGAIDATRQFALLEAQAACDELHKLPPSRAREALLLVVQSAVHRMH